MNCDVFVINENLKFDELKKDFSNRLKDINIHIFSTFNNILKTFIFIFVSLQKNKCHNLFLKSSKEETFKRNTK